MCGMWGTAYDGDPIKLKMDFFNYFSCEMGDWGNNHIVQLNEQIRFKGIMEVGSMYALAVGGKGFTRIFPFMQTQNTEWVTNPHTNVAGNVTYDLLFQWGFIGASLLLENTIKIPNILNIAINAEFMFTQWGDNAHVWGFWGNSPNDPNSHTDLDIFMTVGLNGSYSFGFSWSLTQDVIIGLNLEKVAGNDPAVDGTIMKSTEQAAYFSKTPFFRTTLNLSQDILSLAGVKDVTLKVSFDELLMIYKPYSGEVQELTSFINTQTVAGLTVGFYGFSVGGFFTLATQDTYNTDKPMNGYAGSSYAGVGSPVSSWSDRNPGRGQAGLMLKFGYSRGFFGFDIAYHGQGQIRDFDYASDNFASVVNNMSGMYADHGGLFRSFNTYHR